MAGQADENKQWLRIDYPGDLLPPEVLLRVLHYITQGSDLINFALADPKLYEYYKHTPEWRMAIKQQALTTQQRELSQLYYALVVKINKLLKFNHTKYEPIFKTPFRNFLENAYLVEFWTDLRGIPGYPDPEVRFNITPNFSTDQFNLLFHVIHNNYIAANLNNKKRFGWSRYRVMAYFWSLTLLLGHVRYQADNIERNRELIQLLRKATSHGNMIHTEKKRSDKARGISLFSTVAICVGAPITFGSIVALGLLALPGILGWVVTFGSVLLTIGLVLLGLGIALSLAVDGKQLKLKRDAKKFIGETQRFFEKYKPQVPENEALQEEIELVYQPGDPVIPVGLLGAN